MKFPNSRQACIYLLGLTGLLLCSCIKNITASIRNIPPVLVVDGSITTDPPPYKINLSYSGNFTNAYQAGTVLNQYFVTDARVSIEDDLGDSTACFRSVDGTYLSADSGFIGTVERTYTLRISLSDGRTYLSSPEKITPVPPIDSVTVVYDSSLITDIRPTQLIVSVNTHDPPGVRNYYRWTASGYVPRKSWGDTCNIFVIIPCRDPFDCSCGALCEQFLKYNPVNVFSDQFIDGNSIVLPVFYSPVYWFGKHFIEIKQYSLSREADEFWQQYLDQTNRTGSILDPLPASLAGNLHNQSDARDIALGFFSASDVFTKKLVIVPFFLQQYWLVSTAGAYVKEGQCELVYPNTLPNNADAPGWEHAQTIEMH